MPADRVYKCRVRPCQSIKGTNNHWFVATIDKFGRMIIERFDKADRFVKAANAHGANEICSERCLHIHLNRWTSGRITASDKPECASPAFRTHTTLTAWVSSVYSTNTFPREGEKEKSPARIISYRDNGHEQHIWCFNQDAFPRIEQAINAHVKFRIKSRGDYSVVLDVIEVLDAAQVSKGEQHVNSAAASV